MRYAPLEYSIPAQRQTFCPLVLLRGLPSPRPSTASVLPLHHGMVLIRVVVVTSISAGISRYTATYSTPLIKILSFLVIFTQSARL